MKEKLLEIFNIRPSSPLSQEESMMLIGMYMSGKKELNTPIKEINRNSEFYKEIKPFIDTFEIQMFLKRLEGLTTLKMTMGALALISQRFNSLGDVVMYTFYLHKTLKPDTVVTLDVFSTQLFPFGMLSTDQLRQMWDAQKVTEKEMEGYNCIGAYDNLLDYKEMWEK